MGKMKLVDLSHPFGAGSPLWPYFADIKVERFHYQAKSGVLTQWLTTPMHVTTHADSPIHVVEDADAKKWYRNRVAGPEDEHMRYTHEIPLDCYYGPGVVVDIPKKQWELVTAKDLDNATPKIQKGDIVIVHTGWNRYWGDNKKYFAYAPGLGREAGEWFVDKGVKAVGVDQQALDHPLNTAIGPHGVGPLLQDVNDEYERVHGRKVIEDFPEWEPCHKILLCNGVMGFENVGGDIAKVVGKRVKIMGFPIRWYKGDGSIVRLVAEIDEDDMNKVPDRVYPYGVF
jgi:kynurenine formamidase